MLDHKLHAVNMAYSFHVIQNKFCTKQNKPVVLSKVLPEATVSQLLQRQAEFVTVANEC